MHRMGRFDPCLLTPARQVFGLLKGCVSSRTGRLSPLQCSVRIYIFNHQGGILLTMIGKVGFDHSDILSGE